MRRSRCKLGLVLLLLGLATHTSWAQVSQKHHEVEIQSRVSIFNYTYRLSLSPGFLFRDGRHSYGLGPVVLIGANTGSGNDGPRLTGLRVGYRYFPSTTTSRLNFYVSTEIIGQRIAEQWQANAFDTELGSYRDLPYKSKELLIENHSGYGIQLKLSQSWYLFQGIGVGFYYSNFEGEAPTVQASLLDNIDYRGYDDFGFSWSIRLGIGYRFLSK